MKDMIDFIIPLSSTSSLLFLSKDRKTEDKAGLGLNTKNSKTVFYFLITIMFRPLEKVYIWSKKIDLH
jgi:hypothetical protein